MNLGASEGMCYLAWQYHQGVNVEKDDLKALDLYERASRAGNIYAPHNAGVCIGNCMAIARLRKNTSHSVPSIQTTPAKHSKKYERKNHVPPSWR